MTTNKSDNSLLLNFRTDTKNRVSLKTVKNLAIYLGFNTETQVIHYALRKLAKEVLPAYEVDDGALSYTQIQAIRKVVKQDKQSVKSTLV